MALTAPSVTSFLKFLSSFNLTYFIDVDLLYGLLVQRTLRGLLCGFVYTSTVLVFVVVLLVTIGGDVRSRLMFSPVSRLEWSSLSLLS